MYRWEWRVAFIIVPGELAAVTPSNSRVIHDLYRKSLFASSMIVGEIPVDSIVQKRSGSFLLPSVQS